MKRLLITFLISFSSYIQSAQSINCDCVISDLVWQQFQRQKTCSVSKVESITNDNTTITSINNSYKDGSPSQDVRIFYVLLKTVYYIPKGLDIVFANMIGMKFDSTKLRHITKENFRPFPDLLMFASVSNHIQFIEKDLFMYTKKIQYISLKSNRITYIDPQVFNVIRESLVQFWIDGSENSCGLSNAETKSAVGNVIDSLNSSSCANINNAPPLYKFWVIAQEEDLNDECETKLAEKDAELTAIKAEMDTKEAECTAKIKDLEDKIVEERKTMLEYIKCLNDPTLAECPKSNSLENLQERLEKALRSEGQI